MQGTGCATHRRNITPITSLSGLSSLSILADYKWTPALLRRRYESARNYLAGEPTCLSALSTGANSSLAMLVVFLHQLERKCSSIHCFGKGCVQAGLLFE